MRYGTCNFLSLKAAMAYYMPYGCSKEDVVEMVHHGAVAIGKPVVPEGSYVYLDNGRYIVEHNR